METGTGLQKLPTKRREDKEDKDGKDEKGAGLDMRTGADDGSRGGGDASAVWSRSDSGYICHATRELSSAHFHPHTPCISSI